MTLTMETWLAQYRQQMLERSLAATVDYNLKLDLPIDTLLGKVNVRTVPDQSRLDVTVDDGDPNRARDIAFAWAQMYIEQHQREASPLDPPNRVEVTMQQTPASGTPLFPNTPAFFLAVGVFGLVLGTVLALLPSSGHTTSA
jgi:capsular polysaccharide biosynthesis protein